MTKATDEPNIFQTGRDVRKRRRTPVNSQTTADTVAKSNDVNHSLFIPPMDADDFVVPGLPPVEMNQVTRALDHTPVMLPEGRPVASFLSQLREGCISSHLFAEAFVVDTVNLTELRNYADLFSFSTQTIVTELEDGEVARRAWLIIGINPEIVSEVAKYVEEEWKRKIKRCRNAHRIVTVDHAHQDDEISKAASAPAKSTILSWSKFILAFVLSCCVVVIAVGYGTRYI